MYLEQIFHAQQTQRFKFLVTRPVFSKTNPHFMLLMRQHGGKREGDENLPPEGTLAETDAAVAERFREAAVGAVGGAIMVQRQLFL